MSYASQNNQLVNEAALETDPLKETPAIQKLRALDAELLPKVKEITDRWSEGLLSCMDMVNELISLTYTD